MVGLAVALAGLNLIAVALLAIPVSLFVDIQRSARWHSRVRVQWLFGLVNIETGGRPPPPVPTTAVGRPRRTASPGGPPTRGGRDWAVALALVRTRGLPGRVLRLGRDVVARLSVDRFSLRVDFGLDDPADTGQLYGVLAPFVVAATSRGFDVRCRPDFREPGVRGSCRGQIRGRPLSVIRVVVGFLVSPTALRAMRQIWAAQR